MDMQKRKYLHSLAIALLLFWIAVLNASGLQAQCGSILNGNIQGTENRPANGWNTLSGTSKVKSAATLSRIGPSPQGGSILQITSSDRDIAKIQTQISGLSPGNYYTLSWYAGIEFNRPSSENTVGYLVKGANQTQWYKVETNSWEQSTMIFLAESRSFSLEITLPRSSELFIDGLQISCGGSMETCPSLVQGYMNGKINKMPHGWTSDIQTARLLSPSNLRVIGPSPQGGAVLMLNEHKNLATRIETQLYGLNPGSTYTISWYSAVEPHLLGANNSQAAYTLKIEGSQSSHQAVSSSWKQESISFVANSSNPKFKIDLGRTRNTSSRMVLDGFEISCSNACNLIIPSYSKN